MYSNAQFSLLFVMQIRWQLLAINTDGLIWYWQILLKAPKK
jgi:hypothetical protein